MPTLMTSLMRNRKNSDFWGHYLRCLEQLVQLIIAANKDITADVTAIVRIAHHIMVIVMEDGIMGMTMFTAVNLVVIEAVEAWVNGRDCCYGRIFREKFTFIG